MQKTSVELLTIAETAGRIKRKESTLRDDILKRRIPFVRIGRSVRIPVEAVNKMIASGWVDAVE